MWMDPKQCVMWPQTGDWDCDSRYFIQCSHGLRSTSFFFFFVGGCVAVDLLSRGFVAPVLLFRGIVALELFFKVLWTYNICSVLAWP